MSVTNEDIAKALKGRKPNPKEFYYILDGYYHKDNYNVEWNRAKEYYVSIKNRS